MSNIRYDPRLKVAAKEIKNILEKHCVGGVIALASETHGETVIHLPKWSLIAFEGDAIRFRFRSKEPKRSESSLALFLMLRDGAANMTRGLLDVADTILARMKEAGNEVEHTPLKDFTPDTWEE